MGELAVPDGAATPFADEFVHPDIRDSDVVYTGQVWEVREDRFAYGDGELTRHYVDHPGAVAVLVLDESDRVLLIQQYRQPVRLREWELPAGLLDHDAAVAPARRLRDIPGRIE